MRFVGSDDRYDRETHGVGTWRQYQSLEQLRQYKAVTVVDVT